MSMTSEALTAQGVSGPGIYAVLKPSPGILFTGELWEFLSFAERYPSILYNILLFGLTSALGQVDSILFSYPKPLHAAFLISPLLGGLKVKLPDLPAVSDYTLHTVQLTLSAVDGLTVVQEIFFP